MYDIRSSLSSLMLQKRGVCRSQSYENLRGEKGQAAQTASELGKSRKGAPFLCDFKAGETFTLADIHGSGVIRHFFITVTDQQENGPDVLEKLILRMYWEGEETPSVECPLGAFFCCGHSEIVMTDMEPWVTGRKNVNNWGSMPVRVMSNHSPFTIVPARSFHSYFPMAFCKHAKITLENCYGAAVSIVAYQVTYTCDEDDLNNENGFTHFYAKYSRSSWLPEMNELFLTKVSLLEQNVCESATFAGIYLSARSGEKKCSLNPFLRIHLKEAGNLYEPVSGDDLVNGGWSSFRMENPILFDEELELSLILNYDTLSEKTEFESMVYWYK